MIVIAILFTLTAMVFTLMLLVSPLLRAIVFIHADEPLPVEGAKEFRFLADTYNTMYESNKEQKSQLEYDASHDHLTGLYNRKGYERALEEIEPKTSTLLLFDADQFKHINDDFGHEAGDEVLRKIARALQENFRREDYICRIGGDEFAVLMLNTDESWNKTVMKKVSRINISLSHVEDGLPAASVSVGAAPGAADCRTLFEHADAALYRVKAEGGRGCGFYGMEQNEVSAW
jgi:diguanylate cyclase (GGDEF)-like protein